MDFTPLTQSTLFLSCNSLFESSKCSMWPAPNEIKFLSLPIHVTIFQSSVEASGWAFHYPYSTSPSVSDYSTSRLPPRPHLGLLLLYLVPVEIQTLFSLQVHFHSCIPISSYSDVVLLCSYRNHCNIYSHFIF